jgi:hypothetical protein
MPYLKFVTTMISTSYSGNARRENYIDGNIPNREFEQYLSALWQQWKTGRLKMYLA